MDRNLVVHFMVIAKEMFVSVADADKGLVAHVAGMPWFLGDWRWRCMGTSRRTHERVNLYLVKSSESLGADNLVKNNW